MALREMAIDALDPIRLDEHWVSQALLLSDEAGWNQTEEDWRVFLRHGQVLGVVAGDRLVATAAALPYGEELGWVSMVLVTAEWRRKGLATQLVRQCTALLRTAGLAALLDAAPAATDIYGGLGYLPLATMARWEGEGSGHPAETSPVDFQLDRAVFGADRRFLLENFLTRPGTTAFRAASGFAILRQGRNTAQIGPLIAGPGEACLLLDRAIEAAAGPVVIDVVDDTGLLPRLRALGFRRLRPFTRMALGLKRLPGDPSRLLAASGPEFG